MHQNAEKMWEKTSHTHISAWLQKPFRSMEAWYKDFAFCIPNVAKKIRARRITWPRFLGHKHEAEYMDICSLWEKNLPHLWQQSWICWRNQRTIHSREWLIFTVSKLRDVGLPDTAKTPQASTCYPQTPRGTILSSCVVSRVSVDVILGLLIMFLNCLFMLDSQPHPPKVFSHS